MTPKILFTDLDGTLLTDDKKITPGNYQALMDALAAGHRVVITTGRPLKSALIQAEKLGLNGAGCYIIAYNGAMVYDCGAKQVIYELPLSLDALYAVVDEAARRGLYVQTYADEDVIVEPQNDGPIAARYCGLIDMDWRTVGSIRQEITKAPPKALVIEFEDRQKIEGMEQWIHDNLSEQTECFFSSQYYLEVVHKGMDKGQAVKEMCRRLGVPITDAIAAGDQANDISMIRAAGLGVCMCNGIEQAKAAADYITERDNNHDGIAEVVERFMLKA